MKVCIELESDSLNVGIYIEGVETPTDRQALAMRELAIHAGRVKDALYRGQTGE